MQGTPTSDAFLPASKMKTVFPIREECTMEGAVPCLGTFPAGEASGHWRTRALMSSQGGQPPACCVCLVFPYAEQPGTSQALTRPRGCPGLVSHLESIAG
jgi:hypothetical protein